MPKSKKSSTDNQSSIDQFNPINPPKHVSNDQTNAVNWTGILNSQGLPMLPTPNHAAQLVDMNMVVTLAQMMTANVLSTMRQNSYQSLDDEKKEKKAMMKIIQQRLINRKNNAPVASSIKKKKKKSQKSSSDQQEKVLENPNTSALELLAYTTVAEKNIMDSVKATQDYSKRASLLHIFNSADAKSPGLLTALQSKFPNIDWNNLDQTQSDQMQSSGMDSVQNYVSEIDKN